MRDAGMQVESAKGECNLGQHEIAFKYTEALATCDNHVDLQERREGDRRPARLRRLPSWPSTTSARATPATSTCPCASQDGEPVFAGERPGGVSELFEQFLAGQLAGLRELSYFFAPNINSYKRYQPGSFAPTAVAWGMDNRTCALRVVGHGSGAAV